MVNENAVLTVSNLQIAYEGNRIFSDLSFIVEKRDILKILGPNGDGKTLCSEHYKVAALSGISFMECSENQLPASARVPATTKPSPIEHQGVLFL